MKNSIVSILMQNKELYSLCIGCGLCSEYCNNNAISMKENETGFIYPTLDNKICSDCGLCISKCPLECKNKVDKKQIQAYAGYYNKDEKLLASSSGGACSAISENVICNGGIVYGVKYSENFNEIEYGRAETFEQLEAFKGSKYAQSKPIDYNMLINDLKTGKIILVIGLPCQIAAIKSDIKDKYNNLILVSLICNGVTSQLIHREFLKSIKYKNLNQIKYMSLRYKKKQWSHPYIKIESEESVYIKPYESSAYGIGYEIMHRESLKL